MKNYKCPSCNKVSSGEEWDNQTKTHYGDEEIMTLIDEGLNHSCVFNCPNCDVVSSGGDIVVVDGESMVEITKVEYDELVKYKTLYKDLPSKLKGE